MSFKRCLRILVGMCICKTLVGGLMKSLTNRPVCKLSQSSVNTALGLRIWTSRSFLHCISECSQDSACQSVFYDKTTKLCYWNNNNPVVATSCGSVLYLQLSSNLGLPSSSGCCALANNQSSGVVITPNPTLAGETSTTNSISNRETMTVAAIMTTAEEVVDTTVVAAETTTISNSEEATDVTTIIITEQTVGTTTISTVSTTEEAPDATTEEASESTTTDDGFVTLPVSGITVRIETSIRTNYDGAAERCDELDARLVVVDSSVKQEDLKTYMSNLNLQGSFYIGVKYTGGWKWNDGRSVSYNAWAGSSLGSYCGAIESSLNYKWKKIWCSPLTTGDMKHYICERFE